MSNPAGLLFKLFLAWVYCEEEPKDYDKRLCSIVAQHAMRASTGQIVLGGVSLYLGFTVP